MQLWRVEFGSGFQFARVAEVLLTKFLVFDLYADHFFVDFLSL